MIRGLFRDVELLRADRKGVTSVEYAILAVGIVFLVGGAVSAFGPTLAEAFERAGQRILEKQESLSSSGR